MSHFYLYIMLGAVFALLVFIIIWKYFFAVKDSEKHVQAHTKLLRMIETARRITKECKDRIDAIRKRL